MKKELFESIVNEVNMTIPQIKTLRQTLSELSNEAYEEENFELSEAYDTADTFCAVVLMYLRDKNESTKKKVLLFFASDDMSADPETEDYEPLSVVKNKVNLPQFNYFADYVLATLVPKLQGKEIAKF